jgi:two-component system, OmpR family, sensor histidine kinase PhoQ
MRSLQVRVAVSAGLVLLLFVLLTSAALERAFRESARAAREERLLGELYLLMAAANQEEDRLRLPPTLAESRFSVPGSGLYGQVADADGTPIWRSPSALGISVPFNTGLAMGKRRFSLRSGPGGTRYFVESFGVGWATHRSPRLYTFSVAEDLREFDQQLAQFRRSLAGWLGAMAVLLLAVLWVTLRWGLGPLRRVTGEVGAIEGGKQARITGRYPTELRALTENLNALLAHEKAQQERLQNALGDLSHSLKTPLAVIRNSLPPTDLESDGSEEIEAQLARMEGVIEYQLQRARLTGLARLGTSVPLRATVERILASLHKVYPEKTIEVVVRATDSATFCGLEGDLMEMLGNILDNAFKWCSSRVRVSVRPEDPGHRVDVEDDGPGIDPARAQRLQERGSRADERMPGHGIGLAVVRDICGAYRGRLVLGRSELGGARVSLLLP